MELLAVKYKINKDSNDVHSFLEIFILIIVLHQ